MPEDSKVPDSVSPQPEGAKAPAETAAPVKLDNVAATPKVVAEEAKAAAPAAAVAAPAGDSKPTAAPAAKPAVPSAKPPAAPAKPAGPVPEPWESELITSLRQQYGSGIVEASRYLGQRYVIVDSSIVADILRRMRDAEGFDYCVDITAVHYPKREQQFDVLYVLYSFPHNERIRVKTRIKDGEHVPSAVSIWETANWLEREAYDMFGIVFDGHPDLKRILLPDDWHGHPLRKDYDILQQDKEWVQINLGIESGQ
ncbi:MAG: NADH-quinone oxidoreductase subunit C [Candidatus Korobacteraceae bacterium]|jgi:NADH-quinone oxidoreductase subunit C